MAGRSTRSLAVFPIVPPFIATSSRQLLDELAAIDISVPLRTEGRTTEHTERWSTCRFLATYATTDLLTYPLKVVPRDRPDVLVTLASATRGIEITEAVPTDWAKIGALYEHRDYENLMHTPRFVPGEAPRPATELNRIACGDDPGPAWAGDSPEREWASAMHYFVRQKVEKLSKPGFGRYDQDWLLIYDNWPVPAINEALAASYLSEQLASSSPTIPFHAVFVECYRHFWHFQDGAATGTEINDIWKDS